MIKLTPILFLSVLCGTSYGQSFVLEYETSTEHRIAVALPNGIKNYWQRSYSGRLDMNADGISDIVMVKESAQGIPIEMNVFDMATREQIWHWADDNGVPAVFLGFANFDGDGLREPVFVIDGEGHDQVTILEPRGNSVAFERSGVSIALVADYDGDGLHELILNMVEGGTEVWGTGEAGRSRR